MKLDKFHYPLWIFGVFVSSNSKCSNVDGFRLPDVSAHGLDRRGWLASASGFFTAALVGQTPSQAEDSVPNAEEFKAYKVCHRVCFG